ncbi:cyclic nucleotide-binding domain protein (macronuclear) [Tetrahymena thermophila SB210]|uniref:Cyclic nucleotide-binding domain protein n=1 Tax=Tetrahymena thermophila (strain SB210) TaxID=312017 RepID=Q24F37_TETTS|nr:cyclic nucleotide-binding domain protein [Tetrahymena thermophila SB210]EAS06370.2 cyclic nucleotide-binding domain protein [Tetrahymena thermophila SB210]|eukprot:XP_001026615.2 cyclic nucleotide-binding domain protein [Tetrahymena thermophila SB210]
MKQFKLLQQDISNEQDADFLISLIEKDEKNDLDLELVGKYLKKQIFIRNLSYQLPSQIMKKMYSGFKIQTFKQHELIYEQGNISDTIYICLKGQIDSYVQKNNLNIDQEDKEGIKQENNENLLKSTQYYYEDKEIAKLINDPELLQRFKLKREEKLDRQVRYMMRERAKNLEEQRKKEQEKIQFDIQRMENRQKVIQQIIESNRRANNFSNIGRTLNPKLNKRESPSQKLKQTNQILPKIELTNSKQQNKSPLKDNNPTSPALSYQGENNLLLKRYYWKQQTNRESSIKKKDQKSEQSLFDETLNSFSESKFGGFNKGSLIFSSINKIKQKNKSKDPFDDSNFQQQQLIIEEDDGNQNNNQNENDDSIGANSIGDLESPSNFKVNNQYNKSLLIKDFDINQSFKGKSLNSFFCNLDKVSEYKPGDMFGSEMLENKHERSSFAIVNSVEAKLAILDKTFFEEILMLYHEEKLINEIKFFQNNCLFSKFDESEIEQILLKLESVSFKKDSIIYKEDDPSDRIYLVKEGEIEIDHIIETEKKFEDYPFINQQFHQRRQKIAIIGPGQIFGESEILKDIKRITRAITISTTNIFYVFDSNQIKFLLDNSDLKENLNQARQNKSSWRQSRFRKIQIATKNHHEQVKKILENSQTQAQIEPLSPTKQNTKNHHINKKNSEKEFQNKLEQIEKISSNQLKSLPSNHLINFQISSEKKIYTQNSSKEEKQFYQDPYAFQNPFQKYQTRNQSFSYSQNNNNHNNSISSFQHHISNPIQSPQSAEFVASLNQSPKSLLPQNLDKIKSYEFYNFPTQKHQQEKYLKTDFTSKSISASSERNNSYHSSIHQVQHFEQNQYKIESYNPQISDSYLTLNPKPFNPLISQSQERNQSQLSTLISTNRQTRSSINSPNVYTLDSKRHKFSINPLQYYGENDLNEAETNSVKQPNFNDIDTLTPIIKKSKILDSLSKAFKKQQNCTTNSPIRGDRRKIKTIFIYENEPLQQLYMNCKYNHKKYAISRKSKRSSSINTSYSKRRTDFGEIENANNQENNKKDKINQVIPVNQNRNIQNTNSVVDQKEQVDNSQLKEFIQKNTLAQIGLFNEEPNIKLNTNIQQKLIQESTSKYRLKAMKQILESSHQIQNLNYLYKYSKFLKYNETILPQKQNKKINIVEKK